jgi:hypothetical protein
MSKRHRHPGYKLSVTVNQAVLKFVNCDFSCLMISRLTKRSAIYQLGICSQLRCHHSCLVGIVCGDLSIRSDEWRPRINILWLTTGRMWCMRSWSFISRACLDVCDIACNPMSVVDRHTEIRLLEHNIDGQQTLRLLLRDFGGCYRVHSKIPPQSFDSDPNDKYRMDHHSRLVLCL